MEKSFNWDRQRKAGYTGGLLEHDYAGEVKVDDPAYLEAYRQAGPDPKGHISYEKARELVKRFQPGDPTDPQRKVTRMLRAGIMKELGLDAQKDAKRVRLYTAVKTPLDRFFQVDLFVEIEDPEGFIANVEFDISRNDAKDQEGLKHDIILIPELPDEVDHVAEFAGAIRGIAKQAAENIRTQMHEYRNAKISA